ncbi:16S rRNA (cytidine(1402)-2'-O)-methyltransferase [Methylobacterium sp. CM6257]
MTRRFDSSGPAASARAPSQKPGMDRLRTNTFTAFGLASEAEPLAPGLHIVATPIGNLRDITIRALATLAAADAILAEDTRVTRTLLAHYGITTPLLAYHEHSNDTVRERMVARLRAGEALALVSDAGTPLVSDPGYKLVQAAIEAGIAITPVPGPSAVMTALVAAGLPTDRFFFEGFLPQKAGARRNRLEALVQVPGTLVLFESPHRLPEMLADAAAVLGPDRPAAVTRELTKLYETVRRDTLGSLSERFAQDGPPKGEIVVIIGAATAPERTAEGDPALDALLRTALERHSIKDAASLVADETGQPRRLVYTRALALAREGEG